MGVRQCAGSFKDHHGVRHSVEDDSEPQNEAVCMGVVAFKKDPWLERVHSDTQLEVEVREPGTTHSLTLRAVEKWLKGHGTPANHAITRQTESDAASGPMTTDIERRRVIHTIWLARPDDKRSANALLSLHVWLERHPAELLKRCGGGDSYQQLKSDLHGLFSDD